MATLLDKPHGTAQRWSKIRREGEFAFYLIDTWNAEDDDRLISMTKSGEQSPWVTIEEALRRPHKTVIDMFYNLLNQRTKIEGRILGSVRFIKPGLKGSSGIPNAATRFMSKLRPGFFLPGVNWLRHSRNPPRSQGPPTKVAIKSSTVFSRTNARHGLGKSELTLQSGRKKRQWKK